YASDCCYLRSSTFRASLLLINYLLSTDVTSLGKPLELGPNSTVTFNYTDGERVLRSRPGQEELTLPVGWKDARCIGW
ncbi:5762_t:CDS:2, partial [Ambispora gerdemannii]